MRLYDWNEGLCKAYADGLRPMVRIDHAPWAKRIVQRLGAFPPGSAVLDIATGPGFLLLEIGKRLPGVRLIAQDQAEPMLAIARTEAEHAGLKIETVCCPAEALAIPAASVVVVTCKQLLHEADDLELTVAEMARVLKSPGTAFLVDFDAQGSWAAAFATRTFLRLMRGAMIARDFWRSFESGVPGDWVRDTMQRIGFRFVEYERVGFNYFVVGSK